MRYWELYLGSAPATGFFYVVGCNIGLQIEQKLGAVKIVEIIESGRPEEFFRMLNRQ